MSDTISIAIEGGKELAARLKRMEAKVATKTMREGLKAGAGVLEDEMRARAPVGVERALRLPNGREVTTKHHYAGRLRDSIKVRTQTSRDTGDVSATVGPRVWYARLVHKGHQIRIPKKGRGPAFIWGGYWARGMAGQLLPQKTSKNEFVTQAAEARKEDAVVVVKDKLASELKEWEASRR